MKFDQAYYILSKDFTLTACQRFGKKKVVFFIFFVFFLFVLHSFSFLLAGRLGLARTMVGLARAPALAN